MVRKGTTASGKLTGAPRATTPDEARRSTRGHEARQRGTPPATTKAHGQVPSNNGHRMPQSRKARTTGNHPGHEDRCQAAPAAIWMDGCAPGSVPSPCRLRDSRRPDRHVRAGRVPSPCRLQKAAVLMDKCAPRSDAPQHSTPSAHSAQQEPSCPQIRKCNTQHDTQSEQNGEQEPSGQGHRARNTPCRAYALVNRIQVPQNTAHTTQHAGRTHR